MTAPGTRALDDDDGGPVFDAPVTRRSRAVQAVAAAVATLAGVALLLALLGDEPAPAGRSGADVLPTAPLVLVSGGAFAAPDEKGVTRLDKALVALDVPGLAEAHPSAGFARGLPPLGRLAADDLPGRDLSMVAVQGGEIDRDEKTAAVRFGAETLVDRVRSLVSPQTVVVLVGPVPSDGDPPDNLLRVRDILEDVAQRKGAAFVDPVDLGWRLGDPRLPEALADGLRPLVPTG